MEKETEESQKAILKTEILLKCNLKKQCVMPEQSQIHTGVTHSACLHRKKSFAVNCEKMLVANRT